MRRCALFRMTGYEVEAARAVAQVVAGPTRLEAGVRTVKRPWLKHYSINAGLGTKQSRGYRVTRQVPCLRPRSYRP